MIQQKSSSNHQIKINKESSSTTNASRKQ